MWMTKDPVAVASSLSLSEAYALFEEHSVHRLPVVDDGRLVGILTLTDVQKLLFASQDGICAATLGSYLVRDVMSTHPHSVVSEDAIESAALIMRRNRISCLPVVEDGRLVGIITEADIFEALIAIMGSREAGSRFAVELEHGSTGFQDILDLADQNEVDLLGIATLRSFSQTHSLAVVRVKGVDTAAFADDLRKGGYRVTESK